MSEKHKRGSARARILSSLYDYTNNYADTQSYDSNRGVAANTAAAFLGVGLDKLERNSLEKIDISEAEAQMIENMALSASEMSSQDKKEHPHFLDRLMERMVRTNMPSDSQEAAEIKVRLKDPARNNKPPFSIRVFVSNMKRLSGKMSTVFRIQYGLIHIVTWRKPTKTLLVLVAYTCVCLWPHLVLAFPLLYVLCGLLLPAYLHRHPMDTPIIIPVKSRGQSLLQFLNESDESSLLTDVLEERNVLNDDSLQTSGSYGSEAIETQHEQVKEEQEKEEPKRKNKTKLVTSQMSMIINMRDLQNLTTDLLNSMEQSEDLINDLISFKDERLTTFLFYIVIAVTWVVLFLGQFIPWRLIFIQTGWAVLGICHPKAKKLLSSVAKTGKKIETEKSETEDVEPEPLEVAPKRASFLENFDREDIIVDDQPEVRTIEVYELQTKDVLKHQWKHYGYSKGLFGYKDPVRAAGKFPKTVDELNKVMPPYGWKYDFGYASNWMIDTQPQAFFVERGIYQSHYSFLKKSAEGWIADELPVDQDTSIEFRRRRLYRKCYRYSRPLKEIDII